MNDSRYIATNARGLRILSQLLRGRAVRTSELAEEMEVSERTIRRDLRRIDAVFDLEAFRIEGFRYWALVPESVRIASGVRAKSDTS